MSTVKRILVEYEDGTKKEIDLSAVEPSTQLELARLGISLSPDTVSTSSHYVLLQWKDGWQEVIGIDGDRVDLLRYYVITRIEDRGRLSLETGEYWPELFTIKRNPRDVGSAWIFGTDKVNFYALETESERYEGTFEAGGKKEYVKFDKVNPLISKEFGEAPERLAEIAGVVKGQLDQLNIKPLALLASSEATRVKTYTELAKALKIRGMERQADVYGFIEFIVKRV